MASFAIICEGVSENFCIRAIIERFFHQSEPSFANIEPELETRHNKQVQAGFGGWVEVLNHCTTETFKKALNSNDYLIVQIDTDRCNQTPFCIKLYDVNGHIRLDKDIYQDIIHRILQNVDPEFYAANKRRIIFAICFNEIECWFLPIFFDYNDKRACATTGCITKLNLELYKQGNYHIPDKTKNDYTARRAYQYLFSQKKFKKELQSIASCNFGFNAMIEQLKQIPDT